MRGGEWERPFMRRGFWSSLWFEIRAPTKMAIVTINGDLVPKSVLFLSTGPLTLSSWVGVRVENMNPFSVVSEGQKRLKASSRWSRFLKFEFYPLSIHPEIQYKNNALDFMLRPWGSQMFRSLFWLRTKYSCVMISFNAFQRHERLPPWFTSPTCWVMQRFLSDPLYYRPSILADIRSIH